MTLTDPNGQPLSDEEMALFNAHPNLLRLVIKACRVEVDDAIPFAMKRRVYRAWAMRLLDSDELRWRALAARTKRQKKMQARNTNLQRRPKK